MNFHDLDVIVDNGHITDISDKFIFLKGLSDITSLYLHYFPSLYMII